MRSPAPSSLFVVSILAVVMPLVAQATDQAKLEKKIDRLFRAWDREDSPGAAILIVQDGKVAYRRGYGMANLDHGIKTAPNTVFDIASVSKQFCGLAIAMLVTQKKLSLDDDVRKHVPWVLFGNKDEKQVIRIRHLVHHMSGLRDWPATLKIAGVQFDDVISFSQILEMARKQRDLNFTPGSEYTYSNTGYNILAHVVEKVSGKKFSAWCKDNIFGPLGMNDTHFHDNHNRVVPRRASSYTHGGSKGWQTIGNQLMAVGSSSLYTTVDDLAKWILNFETKKVGGEAAIALMHQRGRLNNGKQIGYAFGVMHGNYRGQPTINHTGGWAGFRTALIRLPKQRFAVVVLGNATNINAAAFGQRIAQLWLGKEVLRTVPRKPNREAREKTTPRSTPAAATKPKPANLDEYAGSFHSPELETRYTLTRHGKRALRLNHFRNEVVTLTPLARKDAFRGNRWWCRDVVFDRNDVGQVVGFRLSAGPRVRNIRFQKRLR